MIQNVLDMIHKHRIIVAARGLTDEDVIPFCQAAYEGGIRLIEIPFNQSSANRAEEGARKIAMIKEHFGDKILVGAGTILTVEEADAAIDAGATYILSPSLDEDVVKHTKARGVCSIPGVMTPTEIQNAHLYGADMVKVFPTNILGVAYLKAIRAPLSHIEMVAMGGVNEENLTEFLGACEAVGIGAGICNKKLLSEKNYAEITRLAKAFTEQLANI